MPIDLSKITFPDQMNIREAALFLNIGEQRIRALSRSGELKVTKNGAGQNVYAKADLEAFRNLPRKSGVRKEGAAGKAYVIHVPAEQLVAVQDALSKLNVKLEQRYNYAAQKAYQAKRRAAQKANAAPAGAPVPTAAPSEQKMATQGGVASVLRRKS
jgi:hypothetical protein